MNDLALITGVDIPIPEMQLTLHQPRVKEISYLENEMSYFLTLQLIGFDRRILLAQVTDEEGNSRLSNMSDFEIFMTLLTDAKNENVASRQNNVINVLTLMFPGYIPQLLPRSIYMNNPTTKHNVTIDDNNFSTLKQIITAVGGLNKNSAGQNGSFNPKGEKAAKIAAKLMRGRTIAAQQKNESSNGILARYVSVLTVGLHSMSLEDCLNLTVCQLYDLLERFGLYTGWDIDIRSRLAGATPGDKPDDWMKDIH